MMRQKNIEKNIIFKDTKIIDVLNKKPRSAKILYDKGMRCIGCSISPFESIYEGCKAHGLSDKTIKKMIDMINLL